MDRQLYIDESFLERRFIFKKTFATWRNKQKFDSLFYLSRCFCAAMSSLEGFHVEAVIFTVFKSHNIDRATKPYVPKNLISLL